VSELRKLSFIRDSVLRLSVMFEVEEFWVVTQCSFVVGYQSFRCTCCLYFQHGPLKRWYPTTTVHGVTTQKTST